MRSWATIGGVLGVGVPGLWIAATGLQLLVLVSFADSWVARIGWVEVAVGLGLVGLAAALAREAAWPRLPAVVTLLLAVPVGGLWALGLMSRGVFSLPAMLVSPGSALGVVLLAVGWREMGRVAAERARVDTATAALFASTTRRGGSESRTAALAMGALLLIGLVGWRVTSTSPAELDQAWLTGRALSLGVDPRSVPTVAARSDFPYPSSPLAFHADTEAALAGVAPGEVTALGDALAIEVRNRLIAAAGSGDLAEAEADLWRRGRSDVVPALIAVALRGHGAIVDHDEVLFRRSLEARRRSEPVTLPLGPLQLVELFLHVGWALDLHLTLVAAPERPYLRYDPPGGVTGAPLFVDAVHLHPDLDPAADAVPEGLVVAQDPFPSRSSVSDAFREAAGYYQPADARRLEDLIAASVGIAVDRRPGAELAHLRPRLEASTEPALINAVFAGHLYRANVALAEGAADAARAEAAAAADLRAAKGGLVTLAAPIEQLVLARCDLALGAKAAARGDLAPLFAYFEREGVDPAHREDFVEALDLQDALDR